MRSYLKLFDCLYLFITRICYLGVHRSYQFCLSYIFLLKVFDYFYPMISVCITVCLSVCPFFDFRSLTHVNIILLICYFRYILYKLLINIFSFILWKYENFNNIMLLMKVLLNLWLVQNLSFFFYIFPLSPDYSIRYI